MFVFFSSRRRHTRLVSDWSSDVCSSDLTVTVTVTVNDETKILVSGQAATLADIQVGYIALVRGQKNEAAKVVRAHPAPAAGTVVRGVVESTGSNSITVK